jgi:hypothetical protein
LTNRNGYLLRGVKTLNESPQLRQVVKDEASKQPDQASSMLKTRCGVGPPELLGLHVQSVGWPFSRAQCESHSRIPAIRFLGSILLSEHQKASTPDSLDREYSPRSGTIVREPVSLSLRSLRTRKRRFGYGTKCSNSMELGCAVFVSPLIGTLPEAATWRVRRTAMRVLSEAWHPSR